MQEEQHFSRAGVFWRAVLPFFLFWFVVVVVAAAPYCYVSISSREMTSEWLIFTTGAQVYISRKMLENQSVHDAALDVPPEHFLTRKDILHAEVHENGEIFLQGGSKGAVLGLLPEFGKEEVVWHCLGGSHASISSSCRGDDLFKVTAMDEGRWFFKRPEGGAAQ